MRDMTRTRTGWTGGAAPKIGVPPTFEEFFGQHRHALFGALCVITGNRQEAEEITQDAFLRVWERWERVATLDRPDGYLFRVAMNAFRSRRRRARTAVRRSLASD